MLRVNYQIDPSLETVLRQFGKDRSPAAVIISIEKEVMTQCTEPIAATGTFAGDLQRVRAALNALRSLSAYVVVRVSAESPAVVVVYVSDSAKPKDRMLYSSGSAHLQEALMRPNISAVQVSAIEDIQPFLFVRHETDEDREELMTDSERMKAAIAKMEVAPQPTTLPGVAIPLSKESIDALQLYQTGVVAAVSFKVTTDCICVDRVLHAFGGLSAVKTILPDQEPRFVLARYAREGQSEPAGQLVMVYLCPSACKPREKMHYASGRAFFLSQLCDLGIKFVRRVETDSCDDFVTDVVDAFETPTLVEEGVKPRPPQPVMSKGPRMLI